MNLDVMGLRASGLPAPPPTRSLENPQVSISTPEVLKLFDGVETEAGVSVTPENAIRLSAVYACVRILASTLATLPINLYRRLPRGREKAEDHPTHWLIKQEPNPEQTKPIFYETCHAHMELRGNTCSAIERDGAGRPLALWPLLPTHTSIKRINRRLRYEYSFPDGGREILPPEDVLHVPHLSLDGIVGLSPIDQARLSVGTALALEQFGGRFLKNSAIPSGILATEKSLDEQARAALRAAWEQGYGEGHQHRVAVLDEGMKWTQVTVTPEAAQFLETSKAKIGDIARIYGVPLWLLALMEKSTSWGSGIAEQGLALVRYTLRPRLVRWEHELERKLLTTEERREYSIRFVVNGLMRGDPRAQGQFYKDGILTGWMTRNEAREFEDMNPLEGLDDPIVPSNMQPADDFGGENETPGQDGRPPAEGDEDDEEQD